MTPQRLTALDAALALTALAGAGVAHAAPAPAMPATPTVVFPAHASSADVPAFRNGFGLTLLPEETRVRSPTDFTLTVTTEQLSGSRHLRLPGRRWPVIYFLHGGGGNVDDVTAAPVLPAESMIPVVPDGGLKGRYADWLGGFGALHHAQSRPDLSGHVAALSGGIDFGMRQVRAAVVGTELNVTGAWYASSTSGSPSSGRCTGFGPVGTDITLYTGSNDLVDLHTEAAAITVKARLDQLGLASRLVGYVPRLEAAFVAAH